MKTKKDNSIGIIPVYKNTKGVFYFCLVKHSGGHWAFPKGHKEIGESDQETAKRELEEETGISDLSILDNQIFVEEYTFDKDNVRYNKSVKYFIGIVSTMTATTNEDFKEEIIELKWVSCQEARDIITYPETKKLLEQSFKYLHSAQRPSK